MKKTLLSTAWLWLSLTVGAQTYPFQNPALPREQRVENLIQLLTPEEKVGLMMSKSASVDRLGIPSYNWWNEACHGVRQDNYTVYPQPIGLAAAFNAPLVREVFSQVSDEARANWNRSDHAIFGVPQGAILFPGNPELTFWCPNVNIFRDPRWGRGQETCGEDPYLTAVLGVETVLGMQVGLGCESRGCEGTGVRGCEDSSDAKGDLAPSCHRTPAPPAYYKTHACAKHYAVHSGPEPLRHSMNVEPTNRDLWETYLPAFKALVMKGGVREVMCAYQRLEGKPCCSNDRLLIDILRNKWGYDGLVVTDCDAINNFYTKGRHETHRDALTASADALLNGTDLECGKAMMSLTEGLHKGLVKESDLDTHLRRTLMGRFELGMFDPADMLPWAKLGPEVISCEKHDLTATQAARESMVLLENRRKDEGETTKGVLPLRKDIRTLAVVGPNADDAALLNGNYGGTPTEAHTHTLLDGIRQAVPAARIIYRKACELSDTCQAGDCRHTDTDFAALAREVSAAEAIIIIGGISAKMEGEEGDKPDIELPDVQQRLVRAMHQTGRPVIFVNCSGSAIAFGSVEGHYDALLQAWYPGQGGAKALAEVLFGDYNPGGKLPVTFYRSNGDLPDFTDYSMRNRTYRYFTGQPQYAFGYGLSYTSFNIGRGRLSAAAMRKDGSVTLTVPVTNTGEREGTETIQVYVKALGDAGAPIKSLKGFQKLRLLPGETKTATVTLDGEAFEYYDESIDELSTRPGRYRILYGTSSRDEDLRTLDFEVE